MAVEKGTVARAQLDDDMLCGLGPVKPVWLQMFGRMGVFVGMYSVCGLVTSVLSMYISSQITTIERQFGFSSAQSGFLLSCNDIGFLLTTMIFSYFARKVHIPRALWICTMLYGCAGLICSLAYFVSKSHVMKQTELLFDNDLSTNMTAARRSANQVAMCTVGSGSIKGDRCNSTDEKNLYGIGEPNEFSTIALTFIAIGMIIQGVGKAPRYPFLATYIDDNVNKKNTAMYMGILSGVGIFGPAIAFSLGGVFSKMYITLQDVPIGPRHPAWIGAWWLGFVVFGFMSLFIALPLVCFPRRMRPKAVQIRQKEAQHRSAPVMGFLLTLKRLVSNPVYICMVMSTCLTLFTVGGSIAFMAKYLETQFSIPAYKANMLLGAMNVVAAAAGSFFGGCIVTKRKLTPRGCLKMVLVTYFLIILQSCLGYILGCPNEPIVGYNKDGMFSEQLNVTCFSDCDCDPDTYYPMCGSDGINYMSPCHAGCTGKQGMEYHDCACMSGGNGTGTPGLCETSCPMLYPYLISNVLGGFISTLSIMPGFIVTIRSVSEVDKSMSIGFSSLLTTLCGWFAGPVVFGIVIDSACRMWSSSCSGQGACALYDNVDFRIKKNSLELAPKLLAFGLYVFVFVISRNKTDWSVQNPEDAVEMELEVTKAMIDGEIANEKTDKWLQSNGPIVKPRPAKRPLLQ